MFNLITWKAPRTRVAKRCWVAARINIGLLTFSMSVFPVFADTANVHDKDLRKEVAQSHLAANLFASELGTNVSSTPAETAFYQTADDYLQNLFRFEPSFATQLGVHAFDHLLEDPSQQARQKVDEFNKSFLAKFERVNADNMSLSARDDLELVKNHIKAALLDSEVLQEWKRNPDSYSSFVGSTIFPLIKRNSAPLNVRLQSVIARQKQVPEFLAVAQKNIDRQAVPRIYAELADEQLTGIIDFFKSDVPPAVQGVDDPELLAEFKSSNDAVIASLVDYQKFVKGLLADKTACKGSYAVGASNFAKLLSYHEMVDEPIDSLLVKGKAELSRLQKEFYETAKAIDPKATQTELFDGISRNHPPADMLLSSTKDVLGDIRAYIIEHKIVTIPGADNLLLENTPPFMRATTFAAMDAPGPFEKKAKEAFYFVTLPEKSWDKTRVEEHMRAYTYPDLINTSVHEAYPGHYVQALWNKQLSTNVRRAFDCSSNAEGWAHYCEQMMLDEGYKKSDRDLKLVQIHDALLRCCRYICAIKMHTQGMSVAQATDFFMKEGYQEKANAEREAKRGTVDPTYLVYTMGKLQILVMRDDVKKAQGDNFSLLKFHDAFLSVGGPPLKIVRSEVWQKLGLK